MQESEMQKVERLLSDVPMTFSEAASSGRRFRRVIELPTFAVYVSDWAKGPAEDCSDCPDPLCGGVVVLQEGKRLHMRIFDLVADDYEVEKAFHELEDDAKKILNSLGLKIDMTQSTF